ncbi:MAG: chemotaxis protein CheW [Proteobacteria bacterium]|nr:chemotaxis protein CheW [Pseudomonadota bacterium]
MHLEHTPFHVLLALESAILNNAQGLPLSIAKNDNWLGLSFLTGAYVVLAPLEEVSEIMPVPLMTSVPGVKPWLRGMVTCHGALFPVTDLNGFLNNKISQVTHYSRILVVNFHDDYAGFLVDRVLGLQRIAKQETQKTLSQEIVNLAPFLIGGYTNKHIELPIISCRAIMQHPRFRDVSLNENNNIGVKD